MYSLLSLFCLFIFIHQYILVRRINRDLKASIEEAKEGKALVKEIEENLKALELELAYYRSERPSGEVGDTDSEQYKSLVKKIEALPPS